MARKATPDLLDELLSSPADEALTPSPVAIPAAARAKRAERTPRPPKAAAKPKPETKVEPPAPSGWDYLVISFSEYHGWRPRFINGQEIRNWMQAPLIHDYLSQLGEDGWELSGAGGGKALYGSTDTYQAFFKRAKR